MSRFCPIVTGLSGCEGILHTGLPEVQTAVDNEYICKTNMF